MIKYIAFVAVIFLSVSSSAAVRFELRGSAGGAFPDPLAFNEELKSKQVAPMYVNGMLTADAVLVLHAKDGAGVAFGLRRGWQGIVLTGADGGSDERMDLELKRTAALLGIRFVTSDTGLVGFIGSYGTQHEMKLEITRDGEKESYSFGKANSASIGLEAGFLLGPVMFRLEFGGQSYLVSKIKNVTTDEDEDFDIDLEGFYTTLGVGLSF